MRLRITDIATDIPIEHLEKVISKETEPNFRAIPQNNARIRRHWRAAAALIVICTLAGCAGYTAFAYPEIFERYFGKDEEKLSKELIQTEQYQAKNNDYSMTVEGIMADNEVKRILISVTALNDESWLRLSSGKTILYMIGGTFTEDCTEKEAKNGSYTKQYLCGVQSDLTECTAVIGGRDVIWKTDEMQTPEYFEKNGCLLLPVPISGQSEATIIITPQNTRFLQDIPLETIEINHLGLTLTGTADQINAAQEKAKKQKPEILAQTDDGRILCLLYDATTPLSSRAARADEFLRINLLESSHGAALPGTPADTPAQYQARYIFTRALDTGKIRKIWVNGTEYPFTCKSQ